jgi:hypothetical protein
MGRAGEVEMSLKGEPVPVLVMVSILHPAGEAIGRTRGSLVSLFGPVGLESGSWPFDLSDYYGKEMGEDLERVWWCFERLAGAEFLPEWKLSCGELEEAFSREGSRTVNLDPGYLDHGKLVLASFKAAPDKLYMGRGVYAHTCLRFRFGGFCAPDHSFPDFADGRFDSFMKKARSYYKELLRLSHAGR